jgi:phosphoribosylglycinamide formyltransferase 1
MSKLKLGFFASHGGSNMQSIIDSCKSGKLNADPCAVISNNSVSYALVRAQLENIPNFHISSKHYPDNNDLNNKLIETLDLYGVNILVLAGYMKQVDDIIIDHFNGRVLNIHPALLPKFGGKGMYGMNVHKAVIEAGEKMSGATVHQVDNHLDTGRILGQMQVPVLETDDAETLAERVLAIEHILYPEVLIGISNGDIVI